MFSPRIPSVRLYLIKAVDEELSDRGWMCCLVYGLAT